MSYCSLLWKRWCVPQTSLYLETSFWSCFSRCPWRAQVRIFYIFLYILYFFYILFSYPLSSIIKPLCCVSYRPRLIPNLLLWYNNAFAHTQGQINHYYFRGEDQVEFLFCCLLIHLDLNFWRNAFLMPKICQNSSFMIFLHSIFLHWMYYHCNLKIICLICNRSVDWAPQGWKSSLSCSLPSSAWICVTNYCCVNERENAHGSLGPVMMLCSKRHRQGIAIFFSLVTPFHRFLFGDWPLGTHRGHVGCRHGAALPCAPSHERGEYGDPVVSQPVLRGRVCVSEWNGAGGRTTSRFQRESWAGERLHHWGKSSCENPQPPGLRQWNVQVLF